MKVWSWFSSKDSLNSTWNEIDINLKSPKLMAMRWNFWHLFIVVILQSIRDTTVYMYLDGFSSVSEHLYSRHHKTGYQTALCKKNKRSVSAMTSSFKFDKSFFELTFLVFEQRRQKLIQTLFFRRPSEQLISILYWLEISRWKQWKN